MKREFEYKGYETSTSSEHDTGFCLTAYGEINGKKFHVSFGISPELNADPTQCEAKARAALKSFSGLAGYVVDVSNSQGK